MRYLLIIILAVGLCLKSHAQNCHCSYGRDTIQPLKLFSFANGESIALCGSEYNDNGTSIYNEIILWACDKKQILFESWDDGTVSFTVQKHEDTLVVAEISLLPIGTAFQYVQTTFYVQKFYIRKGKLVVENQYNSINRRYSDEEIKVVLEQSKTIAQANSDSTIDVGYKLFWASISGSKEATKTLESMFLTLKGFDGAYAEEWHSLESLYERRKQYYKIQYKILDLK